jgi:hypothetical protein
VELNPLGRDFAVVDLPELDHEVGHDITDREDRDIGEDTQGRKNTTRQITKHDTYSLV